MAGNLQAWCKHAFRDTFLTLQVTFALVCVWGGGAFWLLWFWHVAEKKRQRADRFFPSEMKTNAVFCTAICNSARCVIVSSSPVSVKH